MQIKKHKRLLPLKKFTIFKILALRGQAESDTRVRRGFYESSICLKIYTIIKICHKGHIWRKIDGKGVFFNI